MTSRVNIRAQRKRKEQRQEEILKRSIGLLARRGITEVSFQDIADRCGITQSAVLHHFKNKNELIQAVISRVVAHNNTIVSSSLSPEDDALKRLEKHFQGNLKWAVSFRDEAQIIILFYYLACISGEFSRRYEAVLIAARQKIYEILLAGQRENFFSSRLNLSSVTQLLHDALLGGIINVITLDTSVQEVEAVQVKWQILFKKLLIK